MPFDWLAADDCARVPSDTNFPVTLCGLGERASRSRPTRRRRRRSTTSCCPTRAPSTGRSAIVTEPNDLGLAGAAWAAGELDVADRHFAASVELCERAGARPDLAWTHHDWAYALAAQGRGVEAKEHAEAARAIAEEIGMLGPDGPMPLVRSCSPDARPRLNATRPLRSVG